MDRELRHVRMKFRDLRDVRTAGQRLTRSADRRAETYEICGQEGRYLRECGLEGRDSRDVRTGGQRLTRCADRRTKTYEVCGLECRDVRDVRTGGQGLTRCAEWKAETYEVCDQDRQGLRRYAAIPLKLYFTLSVHVRRHSNHQDRLRFSQ
jgi:predicted small secreted protein